MSLKAIEKLNKYLTKRFDQKNNSIYKAMVGDDTATQIVPIVTSADVNTGAIANELEYLLQLSRQTTTGTNITNMSITERDFWEQVLGLTQASHETVQQFIDRILAIIAGDKHTISGITQSMLRYTDFVEIIEIYFTSSFADVTFADYFESHEDVSPIVTAAFAGVAGGSQQNALHIIVILGLNTRLENPAVRRTIVDILKRIVLPGVSYTIQLAEE